MRVDSETKADLKHKHHNIACCYMGRTCNK